MIRNIRSRRKEEAGSVVVTGRMLASAKKRADVSRQIEDSDEFLASPIADYILPTPYQVENINRIYDKSNILRQCVDAMMTNIVRFGYRSLPVDEKAGADPEEEKLLNSFIESANTEETLVSVQSKKTVDYEKYGFGFLEVIRDAKGRPTLLRHAKAFNTRLMRRNSDPFEVITTIERGGRRSRIREMKRFRRFVQVLGGLITYFKEFGDPRNMDYRTGEYETADKKIPIEFRATEMLHERQYSEDCYGVPRWISQLPSVLGSREAEEVNLRYFEDNTVPPMIMSVAGGRLTRDSFLNLQALLKDKGIGRDRQHQIMLIEAIPETSGMDEKGPTVQLKIDKLTDARPSDALFKDYDESNMSKVRSSFRLPPVVIGLSQDVTFATANVSAYLAETQVFMPERAMHDEFLNKNFVNHPAGLNLRTVRLESTGPRVTNPDQIIKTLTAVNVMGAVTPRSAIDMVNETMQLSLEQYPKKGEEGYENWMDMPMQLSQRLALAVGKAQQTGEGNSTQANTQSKTAKVKGTEATGATGVDSLPVEHGQE